MLEDFDLAVELFAPDVGSGDLQDELLAMLRLDQEILFGVGRENRRGTFQAEVFIDESFRVPSRSSNPIVPHGERIIGREVGSWSTPSPARPLGGRESSEFRVVF